MVEQQFEINRQELIAKHKAEADQLRLSVHEQAEMASAAIIEREEIIKERDLANQHRDDLVAQLDECKKAREADLREQAALHQQLLQATGERDRAVELTRWAARGQRGAEAERNEAIHLKEVALKVVEKVSKERDAARQELEELRASRMSSSDRDEAVKSLTFKLGDKKRRI
jgi:uncharacterized protein with von Willebrand factor type A (vWA) domain